jgi:hypothetical protein
MAGEVEGAALMSEKPDLIQRLCRSLAFHLVESELTASMVEGEADPSWAEEIAEARGLIVEAGFDIDVLYPVEDRPTATPADDMDPELLAELRSGRKPQ